MHGHDHGHHDHAHAREGEVGLKGAFFLNLGFTIVEIVGGILTNSVAILSDAVPRLWNPEQVDPRGMLPLAVVGITVNLIAVLRLRSGKKLNQRVILLHLVEDILGWVGVLKSMKIQHVTLEFEPSSAACDECDIRPAEDL